MTIWKDAVEAEGRTHGLEISDDTNDGYSVTVFDHAQPTVILLRVEVLTGGSGFLVVKPDNDMTRKLAFAVRDHLITPQYPCLRFTSPDGYASHVAIQGSRDGGPVDIAVLNRARELVTWAREGRGMTSREARAFAHEVAVLLRYPLMADGGVITPDLVVTAAIGRARLRDGDAVTLSELKALATLTPGGFGLMPSPLNGVVPSRDAIQYLTSRHVHL